MRSRGGIGVFSALAVAWALAVFVPALTREPLAGEPLAPPADQTVCSPNGVYCAVMDAETKQTFVLRDGRPHWQRSGWFRDAFLADDGEHLVVGYRGLDLLNWDYRPGTVLLSFWRRDRLIRAVPFAEVIEEPARLRPMAGHFLWGRTAGFDESGRFIVETVEDRRLTFDITTGILVGVEAHQFQR